MNLLRLSLTTKHALPKHATTRTLPALLSCCSFPGFKNSLAVTALLLSLTACTQERELLQNEQLTEEVAQTEAAAATERSDTLLTATTDTTTTTTPPAAPAVDAVSRDSASTYTYPGPAALPGAILPEKRILAFYGNPLSKRMGILGELPPEQMLQKLDEEVSKWSKADPQTPVQPALHAIVVTAQGKPGRGNKYRLRMTDKMIDNVLEMAKKRDAIVFLDVQVGQSTLQEELPRLVSYLKLPNVHLGVDAEFAMKEGEIPGKKVGSFDAEDLNYASGLLAQLVKEHQLPPKIFVVHRFTQRMITNYRNIELRPEVQVVMHMDGWGHPALKKDTYRRYIQREPVQYTGFKLFYKNDLRNSPRMMSPDEILNLNPKPLYIQYQ